MCGFSPSLVALWEVGVGEKVGRVCKRRGEACSSRSGDMWVSETCVSPEAHLARKAPLVRGLSAAGLCCCACSRHLRPEAGVTLVCGLVVTQQVSSVHAGGDRPAQGTGIEPVGVHDRVFTCVFGMLIRSLRFGCTFRGGGILPNVNCVGRLMIFVYFILPSKIFVSLKP